MKARKRPDNAPRRKSADIFPLLRFALATGLCLFIAGGLPGNIIPATAATEKEPRPMDNSDLAAAPANQDKTDNFFVYKREGRPDPFLPFVTNKIIKTEVKKEALSGLQRYEPGQLTLVAIVTEGNNRFAMVEDSVGKGYIIRKGTKIGRAGEVEKIVPNRVIIKIVSHTMAGEKKYNTVDMLLKKKGEE